MTADRGAFVQFFKRLDALGIPYMVGGSLATSAHGHPRQTNDVDLVIQITKENMELFAVAFQSDFMLSRQMVVEALESHEPYASFQISHCTALLRVDCFLPMPDEFSRSEFGRRTPVEILHGVVVPVATAEDIVLRKLLWYELGGKVSDRQWNDVVGVLEVQKGRLDEAYLDQWAGRLGVKEMLDDARSQGVD